MNILSSLKRHWTKVLLFGGIATSLAICCAPDFTWVNQNGDLFDFIYSSTFFNVAHAPGLPLYIILGYLVTRLPFNPAWSLAFFLSVMPTLITCGLIFFIVSKKTTNKFVPYLATLAFAGSQMVFSQAIIPEIYALGTSLLVLTYVLFEQGRSRLAMLSLGLAVCVSYGAVVLFPIFVWRYLVPRLRWNVIKAQVKTVALGFLPLLLYLYVPIANRPPHMSLGPTSLLAFKAYYIWHPQALLNLAVWELPGRLELAFMILVGSLGVASILVILCLMKKGNRTLLYLSLPGVVFFLTTRGPDALVQTLPFFAFGAIALASLNLEQQLIIKRLKLLWLTMPKWRISIKKLTYGALACSILFLGLNTWNYDIGRTLDPEPTTARQFYEQLDTVSDGAVISCFDATTFAGVFLHNDLEGSKLRAIHPVHTGKEALPWERERVKDMKVPDLKTPLPELSDDWLTDYDAWALEYTYQFAEANPDYDVYLVVAGSNRTIRNPQIISASTPPGYFVDREVVEPIITPTDYLLVYPYAHKCISGYFTMSQEWMSGDETNWTVGLLFGLVTLGAFTGTLGDRILYKRLRPKRRQLMTMITTAVTIMVFIYILSAAGMEGVRFVP